MQSFSDWLKQQSPRSDTVGWLSSHLPSVVSDLGIMNDIVKLVKVLNDLGVSSSVISAVEGAWAEYQKAVGIDQPNS
jgi:hypothetical protein